MYIHNITKEQQPYSTLQAVSLNTALAIDGTGVILEDWYYVIPIPQPIYDIYTQKLVESVPVKTGDQYNQVWEVQPLDQTTITSYLEEAQLSKVTECDRYALNLVHDANSNPRIGVTVNADSNIKRVEARRKDNADKQAGEIPLEQADKDQAKIDQKLSEYESKVLTDSDKAITNMYKLLTAAEVYAFDVAAQSWNAWAPPT